MIPVGTWIHTCAGANSCDCDAGKEMFLEKAARIRRDGKEVNSKQPKRGILW